MRVSSERPGAAPGGSDDSGPPGESDVSAAEAREWGDPIPDPVEPGRPDPENVAFVVLGALAALYAFARAAGLV